MKKLIFLGCSFLTPFILQARRIHGKIDETTFYVILIIFIVLLLLYILVHIDTKQRLKHIKEQEYLNEIEKQKILSY